eukprot:maker-scaffold_1-snap-gene-26.54-mRNA-1 protein AED:0.18 eAED:0.18 QI:0/0/0/1/0.75/0.6/5/0/642
MLLLFNRVAAMSVAVRVAEEMGVEVGSRVGYAIRFEDQTTRETRIKYMTDGVLLRESLNDPLLQKYRVVVMDEAHERSLHTDVLFSILKKVVIGRMDFRLVVTSATLDAGKFSDFFGGAVKFFIPGRTFKVNTYFSKNTCRDYVDAAVKKVIEIHLQNKDTPGDILVFMTGQEDITATCELISQKVAQIEETNDEGKEFPGLLLLPMYSQLPSDLQTRIFLPARKGQRKCIVSTNIAETSLTVDGIRFVVDTGFTKINVYNAKMGMDVLELVPVSQANARQRAGRAGRTQEGYCWCLYTEYQFNLEMMQTHIPEIQRTNLANVVLLLKTLGIDDITKFDFMDQPPVDNLLNSMFELWVLGALDNFGNLTQLGKRMAQYPVDPLLSRMLIESERLNCEEEMITIASMLSIPEVFFRPPERAEESDRAREKFFAPESDHLTLLNAFNQCRKNNYKKSFCDQHFIHHKAILKARDIRQQLVSEILKSKQKGYVLSSAKGHWDRVREALCASYLLQACRMKGMVQYTNLVSGIPVKLHPASALRGLGQTPDYVVYHQLLMTAKQYIRVATAVNPEWLASMGPMFYTIKEIELKQDTKPEKMIVNERINSKKCKTEKVVVKQEKDIIDLVAEAKKRLLERKRKGRFN